MIAETISKCCLSYWFPKLQAAGVPVPRTEIVRTDPAALWRIMFDETVDKPDKTAWNKLIDDLKDAAQRIGPGPWFLRTGQTSNKHAWKRSCCLTDLNCLPEHVEQIAEFSEMADMIGLPIDVWVVREMLPTKPIALLPAYGDFPLVREMRGFVRDGRIECRHDYWPSGAISQGFREVPSPERLHCLIADSQISCAEYVEHVEPLLQQVATAFAGDGGWSVDVLETDRGWYVTDMAVAERSYHEPSCPNCPKGKNR